MTVALTEETTGNAGDTRSMGRDAKKAPTHPVRLYKDLAELLHMLAAAMGQDVADFVDEPLRKYAESMRQEAAKRIMSTGKEGKRKRQAD